MSKRFAKLFERKPQTQNQPSEPTPPREWSAVIKFNSARPTEPELLVISGSTSPAELAFTLQQLRDALIEQSVLARIQQQARADAPSSQDQPKTA